MLVWEEFFCGDGEMALIRTSLALLSLVQVLHTTTFVLVEPLEETFEKKTISSEIGLL